MDLTLRYSGRLKAAGSSGSRKRVDHKHEIREYFSKQLAVFWEWNPLLSEWDPNTLQRPKEKKEEGWHQVERPIESERDFFWRKHVKAYNVIPLVTHVHLLHCRLNIRMHCRRHQKQGSILYEGGDLDNRLKVLLDALSMPQDECQIPTYIARDDPEKSPLLFCLLESDELITDLSIKTIPLLKKDAATNYVILDIDVHIAPIYPMAGNVNMLFKG